MRRLRRTAGARLRRCHIYLSEEVWKALSLEARRRGTFVSPVAESLLVGSLGMTRTTRRCGLAAVDEGSGDGRGHECRILVEAPLWKALAAEAAGRHVSVAQLIRERIHGFVEDGGGGMAWPRTADLEVGGVTGEEPTHERVPEGGGSPVSPQGEERVSPIREGVEKEPAPGRAGSDGSGGLKRINLLEL